MNNFSKKKWQSNLSITSNRQSKHSNPHNITGETYLGQPVTVILCDVIEFFIDL